MNTILIVVITVEAIIIGLMILPTLVGVQSYKLLKDPNVREALDNTLKSLQSASKVQRDKVKPYTDDERAAVSEKVGMASGVGKQSHLIDIKTGKVVAAEGATISND